MTDIASRNDEKLSHTPPLYSMGLGEVGESVTKLINQQMNAELQPDEFRTPTSNSSTHTWSGVCAVG